MAAGNLRRNNARKRESGAVVSNLSASISAIIAEGRKRNKKCGLELE
jgi:hypothetical protein